MAEANGYQSIHHSGFSRIVVPTTIGTSSRVILKVILSLTVNKNVQGDLEQMPLKILVPTDFSDKSDYALELALKFKQVRNTEVHVLNVINAPSEAVFDAEGNIMEDSAIDLSVIEEARSRNEEQLENWHSSHNHELLKVVRIGHFTKDIMNYIDEEEVDLIIMGTHGASGMTEMIMGSHAVSVVRQSPVPVLTLKCDRSDLAIKHILLTSDFSSEEPENIDLVLDLQKTFNATLHLLTINTPKKLQAHPEIEHYMNHFIQKHDINNAEKHIYDDPSVEEGVLHFAGDYNMDLIAIGTHGRTGIGHLLKGSISEDIVNHLHKPILTFRISSS
ncbi:MAG: hypothetical protein BRD50_03720 [Bacteroidetes bacterium SW_11_45_7]|nr:MAG: hypothetical protein BRD50_03720 [Bacteroidetes bacterium SW_11_45_7]